MNKYNWDNSDQIFDPQKNEVISKAYQFRIPATGSAKIDVGTKESAQAVIDAMTVKKRSIRQQMAKIGGELRAQEGIDFDLLDQYQALNEELRVASIYKAELVYLRNML